MKRVFIILVNWNGLQDTIECLKSLQQLEYGLFSVIICDNGSNDDSISRIKNWADQQKLAYIEYQRVEAEAGGQPDVNPWLVLINNGANLGFSGGNNVGLRYAMARGDASYCWLLNNDTVVKPDALTHLVARMEQQPSAGICGSTIRLYHNPERIQALGGGHYCRWIGLPWHYGRFTLREKAINQARAELWMNYVEGASMLVSRQFLAENGLMCEDYFLFFEEADWAIRAKGRFHLAYAPQSIVYHKVGGSIGTSSHPAKKSYICDYFNIRNRILFTRRFYPSALPTVWLVIVGALVLRLCMWKWARAMMIFRILCGSSNALHDMLPEYRTKP